MKRNEREYNEEKIDDGELSTDAVCVENGGENIMGRMKLNRLLLTISLPMVVSMLVQALYNVVDSIFVAKISEDALTAVSLAFPMQNLMIAFSVGTGVGINAVVSRYLGEKNSVGVNKAAGNSVTLLFLTSFIFVIFGCFGAGLFFSVQTDSASIAAMGEDYLSVVTLGAAALFGQVCFEKLLQSTGKTLYSMISQLVGAVTNIILDPILIFGYLGLPAMGVKGAAIATVIGQSLAMCVGLTLHFAFNKEIRLKLRDLLLSGKIVAKIYAVGIPSIIMNAVFSVVTFVMNMILIVFSNAAVSVFGVYFKLQSFVFMPVFGLNNGMIPIIAYNFGAAKFDRVRGTVKLSVFYAVGIMVLGTILAQALPAQLLSMFSATPEMLKIGVPALRLISSSFIFAGIDIVACAVFQALGNGLKSLLISLLRQLIIFLPSAWALSKTGKLDYVWLAFIISETASLAVSLPLLIKDMKKFLNVRVFPHSSKGGEGLSFVTEGVNAADYEDKKDGGAEE